jgi:hypothetical protein
MLAKIGLFDYCSYAIDSLNGLLFDIVCFRFSWLSEHLFACYGAM